MSEKSLVLNPYQKRITCCYKCEERTVGCHATCDKYINEQEERKEAMRINNVETNKMLDMMDSVRATNKIRFFRRGTGGK